jgi:hypothetical protein
MNFKILIFFIALLSFKCTNTTENKSQESYQCIIFQWSRNLQGNDIKKVITIDLEGNIIFKNKVIAKLNKDVIAKDFVNLIKQEKLVMIEANNDPPTMSKIPEKGRKVINVDLTNANDIVNEENFANKSHFMWTKIYDISSRNIDLYKYLSDEDSKIISDILQ